MKAGCVKSMDKTLIPLLYEGQDYEGERHECPWCHGGDSGELSFTITKTDTGYLYNCYRERCKSQNPSAGLYRTAAQPTSAEPELKRQKPRREFRHETRPLHQSERAWLGQRYGLSTETILDSGIMYAPKPKRYVFPIRGLYGESRGVVSRSFDPAHQKKGKAIAYPEPGVPFAHWAMTDCNHTVVVVEDFLSALRVQQLGYTSLSLLGTHLPPTVLNDLLQYKPHEVIIALDPDATDKAFKLRNNLKLYFPKVRVAILDRDIKDTKNDHDIRFALAVL